MIELIHDNNMNVMAKYPDKHFDLAIVDPPYGIERFQKGTSRIHDFKDGIKWDVKPDKQYFDELFRVSKNQIIWGGNNFSLPETEYFIIWDKAQTVENFASAEYAWTSVKKPAQVFKYSIHKHNQTDKIHPTQKPVDLYRWLLQKYANKGDKILDTHLGSGSIAIACHDMGFDLVGVEIDEDYYKAAVKRFNEQTRQQKLFDAA